MRLGGIDESERLLTQYDEMTYVLVICRFLFQFPEFDIFVGTTTHKCLAVFTYVNRPNRGAMCLDGVDQG